MKKISNKIKKNILIIAVSLLFVAIIGIFASFFATEDLGKAKDKLTDVFNQEEIVKQDNNVVKNSNFAINTSGVNVFDETTNAAANSDIVDDWALYFSSAPDFTAYQVNDGLYVRNDGENSIQINQSIHEGVAKLGNKEITLTVSVDGIVYSATSTLTEDDSVKITTLSNPNVYVDIFTSGHQVCCLTIRVNGGTETTINWVKVELGSVFTGYTAPAVD